MHVGKSTIPIDPTADGSGILHQLRLVVSSIIGFYTSQVVVSNFFHQQHGFLFSPQPFSLQFHVLSFRFLVLGAQGNSSIFLIGVSLLSRVSCSPMMVVNPLKMSKHGRMIDDCCSYYHYDYYYHHYVHFC